jgi:hypothetical protein
MKGLLGISGKIGCGKSTLAAMLAERLGWRVLSFGGLIKDETSRVFHFPRSWCDSQEGKRRIVPLKPSVGLGATATVRQLLQYWGTDVCRAKDPLHWLKAMESIVAENDGGTIIDDVRFPNEARMILARGGQLVRLDPYKGWVPGPEAGHVTETALDTWPTWALRCAPSKGSLSVVAQQVVDMLEAPNA